MGLTCQQLTCRRGRNTLFAGVSFSLQAGAALWVQGRNGSGKTTLLRSLCGLALPDRGAVHWDGQPILSARAHYHSHLLHIGHADGLKPDLLAWENLALGGLPGERCSREDALRALDEIGLKAEARRPVRLLSQGQRKRVALARLLLSPARPLWILDEPLAALDQASAEQVSQVMRAHCARGGMLVLTTHQEPALPGARALHLGAPC
ncbi:heme exporter protein A [Duganella sp. CF458]|uniref:cytochrome c biogenesis heme-transporting ATPase CcmA n=1 Tax=Duganella sp. CF458 TaxID=1884368 RepID=UPI0008DEB183|nr:cytochrome c biogenesis heme-transporting ATPase CcmA [Duganella sp. CF458]SFG44851.1 heme exporter protein A [Duganella sp. CF458]